MRRLRARRSRQAILVVGGALICAVAAVTAIGAVVPSARDTGDAAAALAAVHARELDAQRHVLVSAVTFDPRAGTTGVTPSARVVVTAGKGRLTAVRVADASGRTVAGVLSTSRTTWSSNEMLATGVTYHVDAVVAHGEVRAHATSSFTTLTPVALVGATLFPDSLTVGVGEPIIVRFDHPISTDAARAGVLQHLTVSASVPVTGGWHWFSPTELHFRPEHYWPSGDRVQLVSDLAGWDAGAGMWGTGHHTAQFTVGDAHVALANLQTDQMTVTDNGHIVATYPISGGRPKYPTMGGTHIVMDRESVVRMISSTNGIPVNSPDGYDELVYADVHISDSGEYVHAAPWSVNDQGHTNVSHGCINLSPDNAWAFFAFSRIGDIVSVVGSTRPAERGDHGVMDWDTPFADYAPATIQAL